MKKLILTILVFLLLPLLALAEKEITITEIMYDYPGGDAGHEWIEGYFYSVYRDFPSYHRFLEGGTKHLMTYIQGGVFNTGTIEVGERFIIAEDSEQFLLDYPDFTGKLFDSSFSLSNTGETIAIINNDGTIVYDEVTFSSDVGGVGDGGSLQLSGGTWISADPTPGQEYIEPSEPIVDTVEISGFIDVDTTWTHDNVYLLNGEVTVTASSTLVIETGTVVKVVNGGAGVLKVRGTLIATGTPEDKIYFTSVLDDSVGGHTNSTGVGPNSGDWQGVYFENDSNGNLSNVVVNYGGYGGGLNSMYGFFTSINNNGGTVIADNIEVKNGKTYGFRNASGSTSLSSVIIDGHEYGVFIESGDVVLSDSLISNNTSYGIDARGDSTKVSLHGNNFLGNNKTAFVETSVDFSHSGNTSEDLKNRGFEMVGHVRDGSIWNSDDLPIINVGGITVSPGTTLTLLPGTVVKMNQDSYLQVEGSLEISGDLSKNIFITSAKDDSVMGDTNGDGDNTSPNSGDWSFILFTEGSSGNFSRANISYAGGYIYPYIRAGVVNRGGNIVLDNVNFSNNYASDIYQEGGVTTVTGSDFLSNYNGLVLIGGEASIVGSSFNTNMTAVDNRSASSTINAVRNWWGTSSGPRTIDGATGLGAYAFGSVDVEPWIKRDPVLPNPVIIVPGMMGSQFFDGDKIIGNLVWPNLINIVLYVNDEFLDVLSLDSNGNPQDGSIVTGEIIKDLNGTDYFTGLLELLERFSYIENDNLFTSPYDWRIGLSSSSSSLVSGGAYSLKEKINEVKMDTGAEKVDLIAHSMGGLLVKGYLNNYGGSSVDKFIVVATPQTGAPAAFKTISYGDNLGVSHFFGLVGVNSQRIKSISQNMPAVYQLLPSRSYFDDSDADYKYYVFDGINGGGRLNYDQTKDYMKSSGRNAGLVDRADEFHQEVDSLNPADYGVETYNIVGCGTPTIGQFYILDKDGDHYNYNIRFINGDGTVPLKSAQAIPALQTYYLKGAQHAVMPSASGIKELITSILTGNSYNMSDYSNMVTSANECPIPDGKIVSFHSPINLHVYDSSGNHTGPNEDGDIENNISGVVYEQIEDNKFAFLPEGRTYQITGVSTGSGTFDVRIEDMVDGEIVQTSIFSDLPLTEITQTNFDIGVGIPNQIYLDVDGDDSFESVFDVSTTTNGFLESTGSQQEDLGPEPEPELETELEPEVVVATNNSGSGGSRSVIRSVDPILASVASIGPIGQIRPIGRDELVDDLGVGTNSQNVLAEPLATTSIANNNIKNTAIVYKSVGTKLKDFFKSIWRWFINKL